MNQVQHGGDIYRNKIRYDFSVNLNPLGMPSGVVKVLQEQAGDWGCYPDPECRRLVDELARLHQVPETFLLCGNGAADLIFQLVQAVRPARAVVPAPAFLEYQQALKAAGCVTEHVLPQGDPGEHGWRILPASLAGYIRGLTDGCDLVFFCNPNNPTGALATIEELEPLLAQCQRQQAFLVIDECFCALTEHPEGASVIRLTKDYENLVVLRAFTKTYAMAGLRLGYAVTGNKALLDRMRSIRQPWSVSLPAQQAGLAALKETTYLDESRRLLVRERSWLKEQLTALGFRVFPSAANYLLFRTPFPDHDRTLWETMRTQGILIRDCADFHGLGPGYYRTCVSTREKNRILIERLASYMTEHNASCHQP